MRIWDYYAENFKRLRLVQFQPTGRMTVFTGRNEQGKTSALDVIAFALGGKKWSPEMPMRKGATHMKVKLGIKGDKGSFTITRTQSGTKLEMAPGCTAWGTPQAMLDSIFDELALDPTEFIRLKPAQQVEMLRKAIGLDEKLSKLDEENRTDFQARTIVNAEVKRLNTEAAAIIVQDGLPKEKVNELAISEKIHSAGDRNREVIQQIEKRAKLTAALADAQRALDTHIHLIKQTKLKIEAWDDELVAREPSLPEATAIRDALDDLQERSRRLVDGRDLAAAIETAHNRAVGYITSQAQAKDNIQREQRQSKMTLRAAEENTRYMEEALAEAQAALDSAPAGELIDTNELMRELQQAQLINREIERRNRRDDLIARRDEAQARASALTRAIDDRQEQKARAVAEAPLPVPGLTFVTSPEEQVLLDGIPLQQLGEAKQLEISIALVLARNPKMRLVRIPHGEALDEESLAQLARMAEEKDFYVWMAKVDSSGKVGIYIEDGEVKAINEIQ